MPCVGSSSSSTPTSAGEPFRQDHLLLVAAGERVRPSADARADVESSISSATSGRRRARSSQPPRVSAVEVGQQDVVAHRLVHDQAEPPLARHHADAGARWRRPAAEPRRPPDSPAWAPATPNRRRSSVGAAAEQAGETDHFAARERTRCVAVRSSSSSDLAGRAERRCDRLGRASGHRVHQIAHAEGAAPAHRRDAPSRSTVQRSAIATTSSSRCET